jgi:transcriptional regulator with XRE-family HTH domain
MENYKNASEVGQDLILSYLKDRMKQKKVSKEKLAEILQIGVTTLWRYFSKKTPMPLGIYLEICGALDLRPYLIPTESDNTEMQRMFFN